MLALALKEEEAGEVREVRRSSLFCCGNGNSRGDGRPAARREAGGVTAGRGWLGMA
jgi:NAD(P)H-hydrate repair Nnr-like enzyme with NAD(P)H-hydrate epimerase domain